MGAVTTDARLRDKVIARSLPLMPRRLVRRVSSPYIAGETLDDAVRVIRSLASRGMGTTLDVLGEAITQQHEAEATRDEYLAALDRLAALGLPDTVNVSVKLTALGLEIDHELAHDNTRAIVERARQHGGFVRIDMEDSPWTDATLDIYQSLRAHGYENVGVVVQAYLKRSRTDVEQLAAIGARVRVVKGIYIEPEEIAWHDMPSINDSFVELCRILAEAGCHTAYATHDEDLVERTAALVREMDLATDLYEYQMLLGVQEELRGRVLADGHPVRVYVPYGAKWYEYSLRRLRENPRVAGHVAADVIRAVRSRLRLRRQGAPRSEERARA